jgi:DNA-binding response OmpR family regulator
MRKIKILLLDDDEKNLKLFEKSFQPFRAEVNFTTGANDALKYLETVKPNLSLISLNYAHADNWNFLKSIRLKDCLMPIIGLVEQSHSCWMKEGRAFGIDAYLLKPLDYLNLKTYLPAALSQAWAAKRNVDTANERRNAYDRRNVGAGRRWYDLIGLLDDVENNNKYKNEKEGLVKAGPFTICNKKKFVYRHEKKLKLTPTEFKLFSLLIQNKDQVVSVDKIISNIWEENGRASEEDVKQYIYMLRKKVEEFPSKPSLILNHKGFGYMFCCEEFPQT